MSVDPPTPRTTDCTTASQSNSPNYKIIILRLAPPGNTRDQTLPSYSPSTSSSTLLSLFFLPPPFFLPPHLPFHPLHPALLVDLPVDPRIRCCARLPRKIALFSSYRDYFKLINPSCPYLATFFTDLHRFPTFRCNFE